MTNPQSVPSQQLVSLQEQAIANARSAVSRLPPDFQACINQAQTIPEVVEATAQKYHIFKRKRLTRILEKFHQYTLWLQSISAAVDIVVQINTGIGCPLWAPIKFVLIVSNDHARAAEEILNMIRTIKEDLPRFQIYEQLKSDPILDVALLNIFTDVVDFSVQVYQYFGRRALTRWAMLLLRPFQEEFGDILNRLQRHARIVDSTAVATELLRASESRNERAMRDRQDLIIKCEGWLKPLNVKDIHERQRDSRLEGTCEWIWTNPTFVDWSQQVSSQALDRLLCIYGPHGCGKTSLASSLAEELEIKQLPVLFYSFSGTESSRQSFGNLVSTYLWQLLQYITDDSGLGVVRDLMQKGPPAISELWAAFKNIMGLQLVNQQVYCIIDGVDECSDLTQILLDHMLDLLNTRTDFRVTLLGRPRGLQAVLAKATLKIEMNSAVIQQDIDKFIEARIGGSKSAIFSRQDTRNIVCQKLQAKSNGMFLWAKLMIDELSKSANRSDVQKVLDNLPLELEDVYRMILKRLLKRLERLGRGDHLNRALRILAFTSVSCRAVGLEEVNYACALGAKACFPDSTLDDHLLPEPEKTIIDLCGDFINITNGIVRLVHFSVKEFLTRPEKDWSCSADSEIKCFRIDMKSSHGNLGLICVEYLGINEYSSPMQDESVYAEIGSRDPFLQYATLYAMPHLNQSEIPSSATLEKLRSFIQSGRCVTWLEYLIMLVFDSESLSLFDEDLTRFALWLNQAGNDEAALVENDFRMVLNKELTKRVQTFGENDPRTERWQSFLDLVPKAIWVDVEQLQQHDARNDVPHEPDTTSRNTLSDLTRILDGLDGGLILPLNRQVDMVLRLQSHLLKVKVLTDPLKLLFRLILQKVSVIPVYALLAIGNFYCNLGKLDEALEVFTAALGKANNQESHTILHLMGTTLYDQRKYVEAEDHYYRALLGREKLLGENHKDTLCSINGLAISLQSQGKFVEAEVFHRRALTRREKVLGKEYKDTLCSINDLAISLQSQGKFVEAEVLDRRALTGREKVLGKEHKDTLWSICGVAHSLFNQGQYKEAEILYRRLYVGREKVLGKEHKDTLSAANDMADAVEMQGKYTTKVLRRDILAISEKVNGKDHSATLEYSNNLAMLLSNEGMHSEAEALQRLTLEASEKKCGKDHKQTLIFADNLAILLKIQGKLADAEEHFRRSFTGFERVLGVSDDRTAASLRNLVAVLRGQGKFGEAKDFIRLFKERGGIYTDHYIEVDDSETDWSEVDDSETDRSEVDDSDDSISESLTRMGAETAAT